MMWTTSAARSRTYSNYNESEDSLLVRFQSAIEDAEKTDPWEWLMSDPSPEKLREFRKDEELEIQTLKDLRDFTQMQIHRDVADEAIASRRQLLRR